MNTKKVAIVYGTRPEAIKFAPLIKLLREDSTLQLAVICSGQHTDMLEGILELWNLSPDISLRPLSEKSNGVPEYTVLLRTVLTEFSPDLTLVQGDTFTAVGGALAAHSLQIPVGHLEAGLRSGDIWNPWPEESNRRIIDSISSLHFAPTERAMVVLRNEGHIETSYLTGNTIVDAVNYIQKNFTSSQDEVKKLEVSLGFTLNCDYILFTQHRRESFGENQIAVFRAIRELAEYGFMTIFPVHQNPQVAEVAESYFANCKNVFLIPPQNYRQFLLLMSKASLLISDSGGLQEEAPSFGKHILITRLTTERPEVIDSKFGSLVGFDTNKIVQQAKALMGKSPEGYINPFGDGFAALNTQKFIHDFFRNPERSI